MINWIYYPKSEELPLHLGRVVEVFESHDKQIKSPENTLKSDEVLAVIQEDLTLLGYQVEKSKKAYDKIKVPVLFGMNGKLERYFEADAFCKENKTVIEVEAGRGVTNYQFLKDLFQACLMHGVDYLVIAIRNHYRNNKNFETVRSFFDALYASGRLKLPLQGVLVIGY